ncbi:p24 capsid [Clostera anachoreta granulovirus]|uniref:p24 capsid n=1 Tax=Clostera anachoreta granulovirus TaxID=283675 RepID=F4ZKT4_9BBAC|nr:p24 capsid [Clostera anachoreta granulovirus]AEB00345.1 p24 capsid [Clostera anachoreta granulovirus]
MQKSTEWSVTNIRKMAFEYTGGPIEVFIVSDEEKGVNGYAEVTAVCQLLSPYTRLTPTQLWNTTHPSYRIQNAGKNFIHAIAVCKHISAIPENESAGYASLRRLVRDLFVGDQREVEDEVRRELAGLKVAVSEIGEVLESRPRDSDTTLSDFNSLLRVLKAELISELRGDVATNAVEAIAADDQFNEV